MLPELTSLCRQTVWITRRLSVDSYGEPVYAAPVPYRVRLGGLGGRRLQTAQGEELIATQRIYFATNPTLNEHDRVTLSTEDAGSTESGALQPTIWGVTRQRDDLGRRHLIVDTSPRWGRTI